LSDARQATGRLGEALAAARLEAAGWRILARNWRGPGGEIDLVALDGDCLVLVEVRSRRTARFGLAEESLVRQKRARMARLAEAYVQDQAWAGPYRVDVVAIDLAGERVRRWDHYRDALEGQ
jgi:putative endonuclease